MLQVALLGTFRILVDGALVHSDLGPSGKRMASYLFAFPARVHRREKLAELFWPDLDPERSRAAFNSALWRLRNVLGQEPASRGGVNLRTLGADIVLEPQPWLQVDLHLFETNVRRLLGQPGALHEAAAREELQSALDRYDRPFLDGEDSDWVLEERERLHSLFVRAAITLVRHYGHAGAYEDGVALARRVLHQDPYRESVLRTLLVLLALNDQRYDALKLYDSWKTALRKEMGVEPMPATAQLIGELRGFCTAEQFEALRRRELSILPH